MTNHRLSAVLLATLLAACTPDPYDVEAGDPSPDRALHRADQCTTPAADPQETAVPFAGAGDQGWTCALFTFGDQIWLRSYHDGSGQFDYRIGPGGVIAEMRDAANAYAPLLSPSFHGERTDRVIQWTWWSNAVNQPGVPVADVRFNMTQGGNSADELAGVVRVDFDPSICQVDVYSVLDRQWFPALDPHMGATISALTRYRLVREGDLLVRRVMLIDGIEHRGQATRLPDLYVEGWTPFRKGAFDALGYAFDAASGAPRWWVNESNLTPYPNLSVTNTFGYAAVFAQGTRATSVAVGVVFGTKEACRWEAGTCTGPTGRHALNQMQWDTGIGVLPGLTLQDVPSGTVIDQELYLVPARGLNQHAVRRLDHRAATVRAPRVLSPGSTLAGDLCSIVPALERHSTMPGQALENLASVIQ